MKRSIVVLFGLMFLITTHSAWSQDGGNNGSGNGESVEQQNADADKVSLSLLHESLEARAQDAEFFHFIEELAALGENTGAGGFGRVWYEKFKARAAERASQETLDPRAVNGRRYYFSKERTPGLAYNDFEVRNIVSFTTRSYGEIQATEVFLFHLNSTNRPAETHTLRNLLAIELIDGEVVMMDEILGVEIEINIRQQSKQ